MATPTFSPNGGGFNDTVTFTMSTATAGATIRYTLDGTAPTSTSTLYSSAITLTSTKVVKAKAFKS
ncbi:chitobiase/beta-hexosaminidase C-terminal domain-containing protein, partial [Listeria monocytogenes]|uniref:chitobiase/beta-hexosaminidase C-terminal domain-containing protein n=1 Tax=Listeria monocytogenes TaxID=1639 RepID=UPI002FDBC1BD